MAEYELRVLPLEKVQPAEYNPRVHLSQGDPDYEKLKDSLESLGVIDPIVWNENTGRIVGGHQRYQVMADLGYEAVPVYVVHLSEEQEKQANLALNKITGRFDQRKLEEVLAGLPPEVALLAGFDGKDLKRLDDVESTSFRMCEYGEEAYSDDQFDAVCPSCGFRFNP